MTIKKKTIGRLPVNLGEYDSTRAYGKKNRVLQYGCELESKVENNTYPPYTWDGANTFNLDSVHWVLISGSPEVWAAAQPKPASTGTTGDYPYNGMGRVVFKKNMIQGVNTLTQDMFYKGEVGSRVPNTDTIYVIQYDFTLGEDITVPANCILEFDGGSISGAYTITGSNTGIQAGLVKIFNTNVTLDGTWNIEGAYPEWFGAEGDSNSDDTPYIEACDFFRHIILRANGVYYIKTTIQLNSETSIEGNNATFLYIRSLDYVIRFNNSTITETPSPIRNISMLNVEDAPKTKQQYLFRVDNCYNKVFDSIYTAWYGAGLCEIGNNTFLLRFENCVARGYTSDYYCIHMIDNNINSGENLTFENCCFDGFDTMIKCEGANIDMFFKGCSFDNNNKHILEDGGSVYSRNQFFFDNCHFESGYVDYLFKGGINGIKTFVSINNSYVLFNQQINTFNLGCTMTVRALTGNFVRLGSRYLEATGTILGSESDSTLPQLLGTSLLRDPTFSYGRNVDWKFVDRSGNPVTSPLANFANNKLTLSCNGGRESSIGFDITTDGTHSMIVVSMVVRRTRANGKLNICYTLYDINNQAVDYSIQEVELPVSDDYVRVDRLIGPGGFERMPAHFCIEAEGQGNEGIFEFTELRVYRS